MFIRGQPYNCLGIEWLTQGGGGLTIFHVYKGQAPTPNPTPELHFPVVFGYCWGVFDWVWEFNGE